MEKFITRNLDVTEVHFLGMKNGEITDLTEVFNGVKLTEAKAEKLLKKSGYDRVMVTDCVVKNVKATAKLEDFMSIATITE